MSKKGIYNIGFMDLDVIKRNGQIGPRIIYSWPWISSMLVRSLYCHSTSNESFDFYFHHFNLSISIYPTFHLYMCINRFHWILLYIEIDRAWVEVFDSLRKLKEDYKDLIEIMQKVWARFIKRHIGVTSMSCDLDFKFDFLIWIHIAHLLSFI